MSESYELRDLDRLTVGTVGPPGQRVFYLQARQGAERVTLKVEKQQVAALCELLTTVLADLPPPEELPDELDLEEPLEPDWAVGALGVTYDEDEDRIVLVAEELVPPDDDVALATSGRAQLTATREQIAAFVAWGTELVAAGRPPCRWCGLPVDPEGHACPKTNGHLHPS